MKNNFKRKAWVSSAIILGGMIVAFGALYYFSGDLTVQADKVILEEQAVSGQNSALDSLATLKRDQAVAASYNSAISQILPDQYGVVGFNGWLAKIAKPYGVSVSASFQGNSTPTSPPSPSTPGTVPFSISIQGPLDSTAKYLHDIESNEAGYIFTLSNFDYTFDSFQEKINAQGELFFK